MKINPYMDVELTLLFQDRIGRLTLPHVRFTKGYLVSLMGYCLHIYLLTLHSYYITQPYSHYSVGSYDFHTAYLTAPRLDVLSHELYSMNTMIYNDQYVMRHGNYDRRTGKLLKGSDEAIIVASAHSLATEYDKAGREHVDIYTSGSDRALETADLVSDTIGRPTTITVMGELNPELDIDSPQEKEELFRDLTMIRSVGRQATKDSGVLVVAHMQHIIALAGLKPDADPPYGAFYPINYPEE
jgi:hypothetical protein